MRRGIAWVLLAALGCHGRTPVEIAPRDGQGGIAGYYRCSLENMPAYACIVTEAGGELRLEKLTGSVRFRGRIEITPAGGLVFAGTQFCPWGACDCAVDAELAPGKAPGEWFGRLHRSRPELVDIELHLWRSPVTGATTTGGETYGGGTYGDSNVWGDFRSPPDHGH